MNLVNKPNLQVATLWLTEHWFGGMTFLYFRLAQDVLKSSVRSQPSIVLGNKVCKFV